MHRRRAISIIALGSFALATRPLRALAANDKLKIAGPMSEDATNIYYGVKTGLFERTGLDVELIATNSGAAATEAVITGAYDMAKTSMLAVFSAYLAGLPIVITAPAMMNQPLHPDSLLQIAPDSTIKTGADLNGKVCSCTALNDLSVLVIRAWVDKNGGDWKSVKFIEMPHAATEAAITQHRIDAGVMQGPQLEESLTAGTTKTLGNPFNAIAPEFMAVVYIARRDWVAQHTGVLRRFTQAYVQATKYVNTHIAETVPYAAELTKIEPSVMAKMRRSQNGTILNANLFQPVIDAAYKYQTLPRRFSAHDILWTG